MKNIYLTLFVVLTMILNVQAQLTGGGKKENKKKGEPADKEVFDNSFYWTLSRTGATGQFAEDIDDYDDFIKDKGGMGKGFGTSIGKIYYLNNIEFHDQVKVGVDVTYFSWNMLFPSNPDVAEDGSTHFFSLKVGPMISYNPIGRLLIDARATIQPTSILYTNTMIDGYDEYGENYEYVFAIGSKLRLGFGLNIRYRPLTLGFEISSGKTTLKDIDTTEELTKMPTGRFDFVLGFSF